MEATTRTRLLSAMSDALQTRGLHGVGLAALLEQAGAPKGVLYHHFPDGKSQLAAEAIAASADHVTARLQTALTSADDPLVALAAWLEESCRRLVRSDYQRGCPLGTVALESTSADPILQNALGSAFARIRDTVATGLEQAGAPRARAATWAALLVSAYEGGLMQARVARNDAPLTSSCSELLRLIRRELGR